MSTEEVYQGSLAQAMMHQVISTAYNTLKLQFSFLMWGDIPERFSAAIKHLQADIIDLGVVAEISASLTCYVKDTRGNFYSYEETAIGNHPS
jgi:hypothetical protein